MTDSTVPVYIVGGGWAGLTAAIELTRQGRTVVLLEAARQLGGRARRVLFDDTGVDNGQHLLLGAYHATLDMLRLLQVDIDQSLLREGLELLSLTPEGKRYRVKTGPLPAPYHLAWGLLTASGYTFTDRLRATWFCYRLHRQKFSLQDTTSVAALLQKYGQSAILIRNLWEPLCLAALNTPIERASASVFLNILREAFAGRRHASDFLYTRADLSALIPDPAQDFIEQRGGHILLGRRVTGITANSGRVTGLTINNETVACSQVILATPPHITQRLLAHCPDTQDLARQLEKFGANPICTIYLHYSTPVTLGRSMLGLCGTHAQWVFDRGMYGQAGLMAVVISGPGNHMEMNNNDLATTVIAELARQFPDWPAPERHLVIREKRATFDCRADVESLRPGNHTPIQGLWLAGDYTATGLPATLEGAVRSGQQCARSLLRD